MSEYNRGRKKELQPIMCPHCMGKGCIPQGEHNDIATCKDCKGNGIKWG